MNKKIAIIHNFLDNIGGAEIVTLTLAKKLNADIYTTNINKNYIEKLGFDTKNIFSIGKVPLNAPFKHQLSLFRFHLLNIKDKYDFFIISGDWAVSAIIKNQPAIYYMHSPIRELWDAYEFTKENVVPKYLRFIYDLWVYLNRKLNKYYISKINTIICNSKNTSERLQKFLKRKPVAIIHPPIETKKFFTEKNINKNYWLSVNRLFSHKRIEMQIEAFKNIDKKLIIVGSYEKSNHFKKYVNHIKKIQTKNIEIISWADDHQLTQLYKNCTGFITTAKDEDFGMSAVEAMAAGKPVIAPNEGGYKESVIDQENGFLIDDINPQKIIDSVYKIEENLNKDNEYYRLKCIERAGVFDTQKFISQIENILQ